MTLPSAEVSQTGRPRRMIVARDFGELWLGLVEGSRVTELSVRPDRGGRWLGTIVKGRISRLAPGVRAAFVDIGQGKDVFTVMPPGTIAERHLMPGDEVLVQISREAQGDKGHRGTFEITLPGWAVVLAPGGFYRGVSKRIEDEDERERLRAILDDIAPDNFGLIARTAAAGLRREELVADRDALLACWAAVDARARESRAPAIVWHEESRALAFLRDHLATGIDEIIVDEACRADLEPLLAALNSNGANGHAGPGGDGTAGGPAGNANGAAGAAGPANGGHDANAGNGFHHGTGASGPPALKIHPGPLPVIEGWGLEAALAKALAAEVPLPGGGRLVIQSTEALVSIDVNSGRDTTAIDFEEIALRTNLEAAAESARQVRLRDLAGLIVIDFIDLDHGPSRAMVNEALAEAFAADRAKCRVLPLTEFCLAQITRQRRGLPLEKTLSQPCACCGSGLELRPEAEARRLLREARRRIRPLPAGRVRIAAPAPVEAAGREILEDWGADSGLDPSRVTWAAEPAGIGISVI